MSATGTLVTADGYEVLGQGGAPVRVGADGRVGVADVGVFAVPNAEKAGAGTFTGTAGGRGTGTIRAGALETSGVEAARAMVDMIASLRAFEASQRAITTIDSTLAKAANDVGSVSGG